MEVLLQTTAKRGVQVGQKWLSSPDPILCTAVRVKRKSAKKALGKMRGSWPLDIIVQMLKASTGTGINLVMELTNSIVGEGVVPADLEVTIGV